jgi:alpha-L-fucosidase
MADRSGPLQGVPYDGANPSYQDLYHRPAAPKDSGWLTNDTANHRIWLNSITEVIDMYQPDIVYSDSELPFGETGTKMLAHFYNQNIIENAGRLEAVYTCKNMPSEGRWVHNIERGVMDSISRYPWQTDTSIGDWYYRTGQQYLTGTEIIQLLVDVVSKNGNLLLNVVQTPEGDLDIDATNILEEIARWTPANGEGIYGTRPWKVYGEGPSMTKKEPGSFGGVKDIRSYKPEDKRFTIKDHKLFVFCMARPESDIRITSLAKSSILMDQRIKSVTLMGSQEKLKWEHGNDALLIRLPDKLPDWNVIGFRITLKDLPEN